MSTLTRRGFLASVGAAAACAWPSQAGAAHARAAADLTFGYSVITWNGKDLQAIEDIAAAGYKGVQLRSPIVAQYADRTSELRDIIARHKLTMVALSSGSVSIDPAIERDEIEKHTRHGKFVKDVGGLYLQLTDALPKRALTPADYKRLGTLMTEIGKRTADFGIPVGYHNHMNAIGERPHEVRAVMDAADPKFVKLELDTAHYQMGGGDPVRAVKDYADRMLFLHIKDLETPVPGATGDLSRSYRFVELGRGKVDLKGVFAALSAISFRGWAIVELDRVPDDARTPKESAMISRRYLESLGFKI
jgi:inosose dehydratase